MKLLILFLLVLQTAPAALSQDSSPAAIKSDELIRQLDNKLATALQQGDAATVDTILADDYSEIDTQGSIKHKSEVMASVRALAVAPRSLSIGPETSVKEMSVRTYEAVAILTGLTTTKYQLMENQVSSLPAQGLDPSDIHQSRFMKVYAKLNGRWRLVISQPQSQSGKRAPIVFN